MKIKVKYVPSTLKALYGYQNYNTVTGKTTRGLQFDPFNEFELQETIDAWDEAIEDWRREILKGIDRHKEYEDIY